VSSKPLVTALTAAAAPSLREWIDTNAEEVEGIVDAALATAGVENVALAEEVDFSTPTPLSFGDVADLKDDGLTDEQRKRALAWLKKRADRTEGEFDAEVAHDAISLLPGWSSEVLTTFRAVPMNATTASGSFPAALVEAGFTQIPAPSGRIQSPTLGDSYSSGRTSNIEGVSRASLSYDDDHTIYVTPEIADTFREFDPKKTKVKGLSAGRWTTGIDHKDDGRILVHKPVLVFEEKGGLRVTNAQGQTATVSGGASGWKALYGERTSEWTDNGRVYRVVGGIGLAEAARSVVDALTRKVETREAFVKAGKGWGGALCPVCFQRAAVTPTSNHMVDHRHTRPGWGYNVAPCEGNRFAPYMDSPEGTQYRLDSLRRLFDTLNMTLRDTLAHPEKQSYPVKVYVKDAEGQPIYDSVQTQEKDWRGKYRVKQVRREKEITVRQGHPLFRNLYEKDVKARRAYIKAVADSIPFYASAVRVWKQGLDDATPIYAGMRKTDAPALPVDLFPGG
jgi:hypothetical protein